jgi:hypothetical protein
MPGKVEDFTDNKIACYARLKLSNGDPCYISVGRDGVVIKRSRFGMLGSVLYKETDVYRAAMTAKALMYLLSENILPAGFTNPVLAAFTNAALHTATPTELAIMMGSAIATAEKREGVPINQIEIKSLV